MINERMKLSLFFTELTQRYDGRIAILAMLVCLFLLLLNLFPEIAFSPDKSTNFKKWVVVWIFMPFILFFINIRLRQLIRSEGLFVIFLHGLVQFGIVGLLMLKNVGAL